MLTDVEIPVSPAEWQMWKGNPVTQKILEALAAERSEWVQRLAFGETLPGGMVETAKAVGMVGGLTIILEDLELVLQEQWTAAQGREERDGER